MPVKKYGNNIKDIYHRGVAVSKMYKNGVLVYQKSVTPSVSGRLAYKATMIDGTQILAYIAVPATQGQWVELWQQGTLDTNHYYSVTAENQTTPVSVNSLILARPGMQYTVIAMGGLNMYTWTFGQGGWQVVSVDSQGIPTSISQVVFGDRVYNWVRTPSCDIPAT